MLQRSAVVVVACALMATNVQGTVIDSFDTAAQSLSVSPKKTALEQVSLDSSAGLGGYRDLTLQWLNGRTAFVDVLTEAFWTGLSFTQGTSEAKLKVTWDGSDSPGVLDYALGANLTAAGQDRLQFDVAEVTGTGLTMTITVYTDASHASTYTSFVTAGTTGVLEVTYASFASSGTSGAANFSNIGAIVLEFNGAGHSGSDITISQIETAVPEPSTIAMAAVCGLALMGLSRRRKA
ncbi:MAG: PEP-CTERM sorting domain-containing protein [Thermoguttaceae bacterium]